MEAGFGYSLRVPHTTIASSLPYVYRYGAGMSTSTSTESGADVWETRWSWSCGNRGIRNRGILFFRTETLMF